MAKKNKKKKYYVGYESVGPKVDQDHVPVQDAGEGLTLEIPEKVLEKVMYWIDKAAPDEVSGFGSLDFDETSRRFRVRDAILLKQTVSGGSAEIDDAGLAKAMYEMRNEPNALKWHWHSHPGFQASWSTTDLNLIRQLGQKGWIVATVLNQKKEYTTAFLTSVDVMGRPHDIFIDKMPMKIVRRVDLALKEKLDKEFEDKVKKKTYSSKWTADDSDPNSWKRQFPDKYEFKNGVWKIKDSLVELPRGVAKDTEIEWNKFGYANIDGMSVYNPCKDSEVMGKDMLYSMIAEMTPDEISYVRKIDSKFSDAYLAYLHDRRAEDDFYAGY